MGITTTNGDPAQPLPQAQLQVKLAVNKLRPLSPRTLMRRLLRPNATGLSMLSLLRPRQGQATLNVAQPQPQQEKYQAQQLDRAHLPLLLRCQPRLQAPAHLPLLLRCQPRLQAPAHLQEVAQFPLAPPPLPRKLTATRTPMLLLASAPPLPPLPFSEVASSTCRRSLRPSLQRTTSSPRTPNLFSFD